MTKGRRQPRAVLVARVSTHRRSQDASPARQLAELRDIATRRGWVVAATFTARESGAETGPELRKAIRLILRGTADVLVVTELDRFGRDAIECLQNADRIREAGGHLWIREAEVDTLSADGRLQFTLLAALAEHQRRANVRKVLAGLKHARKKGVRLGRPRVMPGPALARAVVLRRNYSWAGVVEELAREKLGRYSRGTVANSVTRALSSRRGKKRR